MAAPLPAGTLALPVRDLSEKIRTKEISPVALTQASLDRLEMVGP